MGTAGETVRAFVALPIEKAMRDRIAETIVRLRPLLAGARWTAPQAFHLTLRFLGDASPPALARLKPALAAAVLACSPGEARLGGLSMFPERGSPRVLYLAAELPRPLLDLQAACEKAAVASGFAPEPRPFRSHLTLARWRDRMPRPTLPALDLGATPIDRLVLFRSDLKPAGAVHTVLATFGFPGEVADR